MVGPIACTVSASQICSKENKVAYIMNRLDGQIEWNIVTCYAALLVLGKHHESNASYVSAEVSHAQTDSQKFW